MQLQKLKLFKMCCTFVSGCLYVTYVHLEILTHTHGHNFDFQFCIVHRYIRSFMYIQIQLTKPTGKKGEKKGEMIDRILIFSHGCSRSSLNTLFVDQCLSNDQKTAHKYKKNLSMLILIVLLSFLSPSCVPELVSTGCF